MEIKILSDKMLLEDKEDVLRLYLYGKLLEKRIKPYENDMSILLELHRFGGYNNSEEQNNFINICLKKCFKKSAQSVRNTLSKYTKLKVLNRPKNTVITISDEFIPSVSCDKLVFQSIISHQN